jgi:hypothetical protein
MPEPESDDRLIDAMMDISTALEGPENPKRVVRLSPASMGPDECRCFD